MFYCKQAGKAGYLLVRLMLLLLLSVVARLIRRLLLLLLVGWMAHWLGCCLLAKLATCLRNVRFGGHFRKRNRRVGFLIARKKRPGMEPSRPNIHKKCEK